MYMQNSCILPSDTNDCDPNPCQNGGACTDEVNVYSCACVAGYEGGDCETGMYDGIN